MQKNRTLNIKRGRNQSESDEICVKGAKRPNQWDKKMLARSQTINPLGSGGGTNGGNGRSGRTFKEIGDDVVSDLKRQMKDQIV